MDALADYAAALALLRQHLPAYVTYVVRSRVVAGPVDHSESVKIVVRSRDGTIVKGKAPAMQIGVSSKFQSDVVVHPPFNSACYAATSARRATFEGRPVEALALRDTCTSDPAGEGDFGTLFVDEGSHVPLAAVGGSDEDHVVVRVEQRFARAGAYVLPAAFDVRVKGSGLMFWLDVTGHQSYDGFSFGDVPPL
jgi:hypothetical protein